MLGLDFVPASSALGGSESGACSWGTVTQTEQNRECSASSFFYGNGGTKFRRSESLCSARWAALLIIQDHLGFRFAQFKLRAHFLDLQRLSLRPALRNSILLAIPALCGAL
jgi:hypothetical protein